MTLDWQVIVICSAALFLRSLTGLRQLPGRALDIVDDPHPGGPERASAPEFRMQQARTDLRSTVPSGIVTAGMLTKEAITIPNETNSPKPPNPAQDLAGAEAEAAKKREQHLNRIANVVAKSQETE